MDVDVVMYFVILAFIAFVVLTMAWDYSRSRQILEDWARSNGYQILSSEQRWYRKGPFLWTTSKAEDYLAGPQLLRQAVAGMSPEQFVARPIPGKWSTLEVVCHLADFEIVYADRIKRVIAENEPILPSGDDKAFAARLAYHQRNAHDELLLIELIREQVARILRTLKPDDFQRRGMHTESGPLTLEALVQRAIGHIPHHVRFIEEKRNALA